MKKNIKKNYIFNLVYQLVLILIPIISIPYLSRVLLDEGIGIFSYSESIVSYFILFAILGSTTYAQREIGKVQENKEQRSRVFWELIIIRTITTVIALVAYIVYCICISENFVINLIFTLNIINIFFDITWFFQGIEEFGKVVIFGLICKILNFAFIFIFIKSQNDLWLYTLSKCGFILLSNIGLWIFLPKYLIKPQRLQPFRHLKAILSFFIPTIAIQLYTVLDKSMIGWFANSSNENGYYEYAEKIIRMCITLITALSTVLIPRVSNAYAQNDMNGVKKYIYSAVKYVWLIAIPLMFGFLAVSDVFVPVYLGESFNKSIILMRIFSPLILFVGLANIIGLALLIPIDKQNVYLVSVVIAAVVNVGLNCLLIPKILSVGAAIASVVAEGIGVIIQLIYVFKKKLLSPKIFFISSIKNLIAGIIMFIALFLLKYYLLPVAVWSLVVLIVSGIIIYFIMLLILKDSYLFGFLKKLLDTFKSFFSKKSSDKLQSATISCDDNKEQLDTNKEYPLNDENDNN